MVFLEVVLYKEEKELLKQLVRYMVLLKALRYMVLMRALRYMVLLRALVWLNT